MASPVTEEQLAAWVREACRRAGIEVVTWRDGSTGLVNVPAKYVYAGVLKAQRREER